MAWIESHQALGQHPKTRKLAHLLNVSKPAAIGHLHCLWWWAIDYAADGDLARFEALDIAIGAEWEGDETEFVDAMVKAGFIDLQNDGTYCIHDWDEYAGKIIERKKANAERMREARAARDSGTNKPRAAHVQGTHDARVEPPNLTVPNHTQPKQTKEEKGAEAPESTPKRATRPKYSTEFESFWKVYPAGHGTKKDAYAEWQKISPDDELQREMIAGVEGWKKSSRWLDGYVKDAERFVKGRMWENVPPPATKSNMTHLSAPSRASPRSNAYVDGFDDYLAGLDREAGESPDEPDDVIETEGRMIS